MSKIPDSHPLLVAALDQAGIKIKPGNSQADQLAVGAKVTASGSNIYALLEAAPDQAAALAEADGFDPSLQTGGCPGDLDYLPPAAGTETRRAMAYLVRERLIQAYHADPVEPGNPVTISVLMTTEQGLDWLSNLDSLSVALIEEKPSKRGPAHKKSGGRAHVWGGQDPMDETDTRPV